MDGVWFVVIFNQGAVVRSNASKENTFAQAKRKHFESINLVLNSFKAIADKGLIGKQVNTCPNGRYHALVGVETPNSFGFIIAGGHVIEKVDGHGLTEDFANCILHDPKDAGVDLQSLINARLSVQQLRDLGYGAGQLYQHGIGIDQLKEVGYSFEQISQEQIKITLQSAIKYDFRIPHKYLGKSGFLIEDFLKSDVFPLAKKFQETVKLLDPEHTKTWSDIEGKDQWPHLPLKSLAPQLQAVFKDGPQNFQLLLDQYSEDQRNMLLGYAAYHGRLDLLTHLLDKGANCHAMINNAAQPLHFAILNHHDDCIQLLISRGADINALDACQRCPLHYASYQGSKMLCQLLIDHGCHKEVMDTWGQMPVDYAAYKASHTIGIILFSIGFSKSQIQDAGLPLFQHYPDHFGNPWGESKQENHQNDQIRIRHTVPLSVVNQALLVSTTPSAFLDQFVGLFPFIYRTCQRSIALTRIHDPHDFSLALLHDIESTISREEIEEEMVKMMSSVLEKHTKIVKQSLRIYNQNVWQQLKAQSKSAQSFRISKNYQHALRVLQLTVGRFIAVDDIMPYEEKKQAETAFVISNLASTSMAQLPDLGASVINSFLYPSDLSNFSLALASHADSWHAVEKKQHGQIVDQPIHPLIEAFEPLIYWHEPCHSSSMVFSIWANEHHKNILSTSDHYMANDHIAAYIKPASIVHQWDFQKTQPNHINYWYFFKSKTDITASILLMIMSVVLIILSFGAINAIQATSFVFLGMLCGLVSLEELYSGHLFAKQSMISCMRSFQGSHLHALWHDCPSSRKPRMRRGQTFVCRLTNPFAISRQGIQPSLATSGKISLQKSWSKRLINGFRQGM